MPIVYYNGHETTTDYDNGDRFTKLKNKIMAKPICLVSVLIYPASSASAQEQMSGIQQALDVRFEDYHVLVLPPKHDQTDVVQMEVIYDKDFTLAQFDEIKNIVIERLKEAIRNEDKTKKRTETIY